MLSINEAIAHAREVASRKFDDRVHCISCAEEHEQLAEWLEELKQLREQTTWIPCNERLPKECIEVLVSIKEIDDSFYTSTSWVQDGVWVIKKTPLQPTVIAWQPLPKPYKESD